MTTIYYSIVERATGRMELGRSNYIDHTERPLHSSLAYAPLNNELTRLLVPDELADHSDLLPVDFTTSYWDFANTRWVLFYDAPNVPPVDPVEEALKIKQRLLDQAQQKLAMPDISTKLRQTVEDFIAQVNSIDITAENVLEASANMPKDLPF